MKMIKRMLYAGMLCAAILGCDKIEGPYISDPGGEAVTIEFPELQPEDLYRRILVEEYTGHHCSNCPRGHAQLTELHRIFGDTLVIVGIHGGSLARPRPEEGYPYDFRTETGNTLYADFGVDGIPKAYFNRSVLNVGVDQWLSSLYAMDISRSYAAIQLINEYNANRQELKVNTKTTLLSAYSDTLQLALYLIEDGIVKPQLDGDTRIENYEHNHVLRASLNGVYGTWLHAGGVLEKDSAYTRAWTLSFAGTDWKEENCSAVAILLDPETREVLQTRLVKIVE